MARDRGIRRKVISEIKELGFVLMAGRGKGSHEIWKLGGEGPPLVVPYHLDKKGTVHSILRQAHKIHAESVP